MFLFQNSSFSEEFSSFSVVCVKLFELLTTVIYPDIALNAWIENRYHALYFVCFLILGIIFLLNIFFSEVFSSYRDFCKLDFVKKTVYRKELISKTFMFIADEDGVFRSDLLEKIISKTYPSLNSDSIESILEKVSTRVSENRTVSHESFLNILDVIEFQKIQEKSPILSFLSRHFAIEIASQRYNGCVQSIFNWKYYKLFVNAWIVSNAIFMYLLAIIHLNVYLYYIQIFLVIFLAFEVLIEFPNLLKSNKRIDAKKIRIIFQICFLISSISSGLSSVSSLIMQTCFIFRLFSFSIETETRINKILNSIKFFAVNVLFVLIVIYFYSIVGMSLFSGSLSESNPKLIGTEYSSFNYFSINFNSFAESWFTLFHFLIVNNWNITASGLIAVSGLWSVLFPISFNIIVVTIMLDVVITFFLDIQVNF
jgi:two pore calcium channel protein